MVTKGMELLSERPGAVTQVKIPANIVISNVILPNLLQALVITSCRDGVTSTGSRVLSYI